MGIEENARLGSPRWKCFNSKLTPMMKRVSIVNLASFMPPVCKFRKKEMIGESYGERIGADNDDVSPEEAFGAEAMRVATG